MCQDVSVKENNQNPESECVKMCQCAKDLLQAVSRSLCQENKIQVCKTPNYSLLVQQNYSLLSIGAVQFQLFSPCLSGSPRQRKCHPKQSLFTMKKHLRFDLSFFLPLIHNFLDEACKHQLLGAFEFDILRNSEVGFWELDKRLFLFIFVIFLVLLS